MKRLPFGHGPVLSSRLRPAWLIVWALLGLLLPASARAAPEDEPAAASSPLSTPALRPPRLDPPLTRLDLPSSQTALSLGGRAGSQEPERYLLTLPESSQLRLFAATAGPPLAVSVFEAEGAVLQSMVEDRASWQGSPATRRLVVQLAPMGDEAVDYALALQVSPADRPLAEAPGSGDSEPAPGGPPEREPRPVEILAAPTPQPRDRVVYLSFDDGPSAEWTPQILELLARYRARATFFVVGQAADRFPEQLEAIRQAGHLLANHSQNHRALAGLRGPALVDELLPLQSRLGAESASCLRAPFGEADAYLRAYAAELGLSVLKWDIDTLDWSMPGVEAIADRVLSGVQAGSVVLMHDGGGDRSQTVEALEHVLRGLSARGYRFEAICPPDAIDRSAGEPR